LGDHPALWAIFDDITGAGEHDLALRYRFAPAPTHCDEATSTAWTEAEDGNLLVRVHGPQGASLGLGEGIAVWEKLITAPVLTGSYRGALPAAFSSLLVPYGGSRPEVISQLLLPAAGAEGARGLWAQIGDEAAYLGVGPLAGGGDAQQVTLPDGEKLTYTAEALAVRFTRQGEVWVPRLVHGVDVRQVRTGERVLVPSQPPAAVDLRLTDPG